MVNPAIIGAIGLGAGAAIGYVAASLGKGAPESHSTIAHRVAVHDDTMNVSSTVDSAPIDAYQINGETTSTWAVRYNNQNIATYITIYGPDSNRNHRIEISRRAGNQLTIQYPSNGGMSSHTWNQGVGDGYILAVVSG